MIKTRYRLGQFHPGRPQIRHVNLRIIIFRFSFDVRNNSWHHLLGLSLFQLQLIPLFEASYFFKKFIVLFNYIFIVYEVICMPEVFCALFVAQSVSSSLNILLLFFNVILLQLFLDLVPHFILYLPLFVHLVDF